MQETCIKCVQSEHGFAQTDNSFPHAEKDLLRFGGISV
jgi:hypothetical protein